MNCNIPDQGHPALKHCDWLIDVASKVAYCIYVNASQKPQVAFLPTWFLEQI